MSVERGRCRQRKERKEKGKGGGAACNVRELEN